MSPWAGGRLGLGEVDGCPTVRSSDHHWPDISMVMMMMTKFREFLLKIEFTKGARLVVKRPDKSGQGVDSRAIQRKISGWHLYMDMVFVVLVIVGKI